MWFSLCAWVLYCTRVSTLHIYIKHTHERLLCPLHLPFVLTVHWPDQGQALWTPSVWPEHTFKAMLCLLLHFLLLSPKCTSIMFFFSVQDKWRERATLCDVCCCCGRWPCRASWVRVKSFGKDWGRGGQCGYRIKLSSLCHYVFLPALFLKCPETKWLLYISCNCSYLLCFVQLVPKPHFFSTWFWARNHTKEKNAHGVCKYLLDGLIVGGPLCLWWGENAARGAGLCPVSFEPLTIICNTFISS